MDSPRRILQRHPLQRGRHATRDGGLCTLELVSWLAGEAHTDAPETACPVLTILVRAANDLVPDARREPLLRPVAPRLVASRAEDPAIEAARAWIAADATARFFAAIRLARLGHVDAADAARQLPRIDGPARAAEAAAFLGQTGRAARAAWWTLNAASQDTPPRAWLHGVIHAMRDAEAWSTLPRLVDDVLECRAAVR